MGRKISQGSLCSLLTVFLMVGLLMEGGDCWCFDTTLAQLNSASEVDFSLDNQTMLAVDNGGSNAKQVNFWRLDTKEIVYTHNSSSTPVSAKFSKDGKIVGIGYNNGSVTFLNVTGYTYTWYKTLSDPTGTGNSIVELDFSWMTSNSLIVCSNSAINFINYLGNVAWSVSGIGGSPNILSCKLNKLDGVGYSNSKILTWVTTGGSNVQATLTISGGSNGFTEVDFSLESTTNSAIRLLSGAKDRNVYILPNGTSSSTTINPTFGNTPNTICYGRDNAQMAVGDSGGLLYIYNTTGGSDNNYQTFSDTTTSLTHCRFSYNMKYLVASTSGSNLYLYSAYCMAIKCQQGYYDNSGVCASCSSLQGCLSCTNSAICTACTQGYYLSGTVCASCNTLSNCRSCESGSKCTECQQGFFLNYSSNACVACQASIAGCYTCRRNSTNSTVFCQSCLAEYYLNSSDSLCYTCAGIIANCMRCFTSAVCIQCQMGYYLDGSSICQPCGGNCLACTSSTTCIACVKGYRSVSGTCTACGGGCLDCYNSGTCTSCGKGYSLSGGSCTACTLPCLTCGTSATNCLTCAVGYYSNGAGGCVRCGSNCVICSTSAVCSFCEVGYYLTGTFTCAACSGLTANCSTCNNTQCFSCQNSYFLTGTFTCQTCLSSKLGCLSCSSSSTCEQCFVGYYLSSGSCTPCASQCESCTTAGSCLACSVGYYLSGTTCNQCSNNCVTCSSGTACLSCQSGYFLNTSATPNVCSKCLISLTGCVSCSSATVCIECEIGRYISGGGCLFCPTTCSTCNAAGCLSCSVGYYLTGITCTKCNKNCSECTTATLCSSCNTGYYLDTALASNNCLMCSAVGCETCTSATSCLSCQIGYYLSTTSCVLCNSTKVNCYSCSETLCIQCMYGYYNNAGTCTICSGLTGCAGCTSNSVCNECTPGYYLLAGNTCGSCPVQCKTCLNNVCKTCQIQYTMNAGATDCVLCEASLPACLTCSSTTSCDSCYEGYYLTSGNVCTSCRSSLTGCISCSSASACLVCQDEYQLVGGVCTSCTSIQACTYCQSSTTCISCLSGYYLNTGGTCSLCTVNLVGCLFCSSSSTCLQCQTGYYLDSTSHQCLLCLNSMAGCLSCASATACSECDGGYYLDTGTLTCKSCNVVGCQVCGDTSPGVCISCALGYYLTGTTCTACSQNACLECSAAAACLRCDSGYYLSGSSCVSCKTSITACSKCVSSAICSQCDSTYYLDSSNQCSQCSSTLSFCQICANSTYCTACSSGYYSQSGSCTSCASISGCFMCTSSTTCQNCVNGYYLSGSTCTTCSSALPNCYECASAAACLTCLSGYVLDTSGVCNQVTGGSAPAPLPIPMLGVKTYYVSSTQLKHVLATKQDYSFTKQALSWSSVTTISLYNSAVRSTISLTITSVQWGPALMSIIFYTNNPLNLSASALSMPIMRLLLTQEDISFSYQTKFQMTQSALALLMPDQVIPNDFTQQNPLMEPSFYLSYLQTTDEFYLSIIGFVIVGLLLLNFFVRATCTASRSRNIGEIVPHILALKTCALMVFPIYPQISSFCYGLMAADLPWFGQYLSSLSYSSDIQPAGFQLYYSNMNFAAVYISAFVCCLLLLLLGYLTLSQPKKQDEVFTLQEDDEHNRGSHAYLRVVFIYFSFGLSFAGAVSVQGSLYNPVDYLSINGAFYMLGGIVLCAQLAVCVYLTRKEGRSCYMRSFLKAIILSVAHISPVYICTSAVALDLALLVMEYQKHKEAMKYPKVWVVKHVLVNLSLLLLYYLNQRKMALFSVVGITFLSILMEIVEHINEGTADEPSKRVKPVSSDKDGISDRDDRHQTMQYFGDLKLHQGKEEQLVQPALGDTKTTFKDSKGFTSDFIFDEDLRSQGGFPSAGKKTSQGSEKRSRPFRAIPRKKQVKIEPILEKVDSSRDQSP